MSWYPLCTVSVHHRFIKVVHAEFPVSSGSGLHHGDRVHLAMYPEVGGHITHLTRWYSVSDRLRTGNGVTFRMASATTEWPSYRRGDDIDVNATAVVLDVGVLSPVLPGLEAVA